MHSKKEGIQIQITSFKNDNFNFDDRQKTTAQQGACFYAG